MKSAESAYSKARTYTALAERALNAARAGGAEDLEELEAAVRAAQQREEAALQNLEAAREGDTTAARRLEQESVATVRNGVLELSNMSIVTEMVNMIAIQRQYESNQKVITTYDESLDIAVNQLGRL
ncbi:MAG: hypothetical protein K2P48_10540 [Lachnospiraceae bacterium]|nr:hypothetical protein [Lachnospiraceae bacterium]